MYFDARFIYEHADDDNMKVCVNFVLSGNIFDFILFSSKIEFVSKEGRDVI